MMLKPVFDPYSVYQNIRLEMMRLYPLKWQKIIKYLLGLYHHHLDVWISEDLLAGRMSIELMFDFIDGKV